MPLRQTRLTETSEHIERELRRVRADLEITVDFPADVEAAAEQAARGLTLPETDGTHLEFVTIDPEGSKDLDQALVIEADGAGHIVYYAIADLAAVVAPGGPIDREARKRGQTMYAPDVSAPLHPRVLSEGAASLLPHQERPAYVWRMVLDGEGAVTETTLTRMRVRSRAQLTYAEAQQRIEDGDEMLVRLQTVGEQRIVLEAARGGASLDLPEEEVVLHAGRWRVERRRLLPVEQWNAQISLMTGMEAAKLQLAAGRGILRTMPAPSAKDMDTFRRESTQLGVPWREGEAYGAYLRRLPRDSPVTLAILNAARHLFRGAGYAVLDGPRDPDDVIQAAIGAPYAHTTAPLRRLVDRYVLAHCEAIANGREIPAWATEGLEGLPEIMQASSQLAGRLERESLAVVTAAVLAPHVGNDFDAIILERHDERARIELIDPAVEGDATIPGEPGARVRVRLLSVDSETSKVTFGPA